MNFLDTVLKVKLYESKGEELCVSFGSPFQCSTKNIVYAKIGYLPCSNVHVLFQGFIWMRYKKQKGRYQDSLKETEVKGQAKCCSYLLNKKLYFFVRKKE